MAQALPLPILADPLGLRAVWGDGLVPPSVPACVAVCLCKLMACVFHCDLNDPPSGITERRVSALLFNRVTEKLIK